jgi:hypothetical protein
MLSSKIFARLIRLQASALCQWTIQIFTGKLPRDVIHTFPMPDEIHPAHSPPFPVPVAGLSHTDGKNRAAWT